MTIIQIIDTFTFYGVDVILLAAATAVIVQLCKLTILKNVQKKLFTFLPFIIGAVLYAVYAAVKNLDFIYIFSHYVDILEHGLSVGALATLLYVLYEQFVRKDEAETVAAADISVFDGVIAQLIEGYVADDDAEEVAKLLTDAVTGAEDRVAAAEEILSENAADGVSARDIAVLSKLICATVEKFLIVTP